MVAAVSLNSTASPRSRLDAARVAAAQAKSSATHCSWFASAALVTSARPFARPLGCSRSTRERTSGVDLSCSSAARIAAVRDLRGVAELLDDQEAAVAVDDVLDPAAGGRGTTTKPTRSRPPCSGSAAPEPASWWESRSLSTAAAPPPDALPCNLPNYWRTSWRTDRKFAANRPLRGALENR